MYQGHMPDGSPLQKHSAGDLFPVIIVAYGDGTWQWVDPVKKMAGPRRQNQEVVVIMADEYKRLPQWALNTRRLRRNYDKYVSR